MKRSGFTLTELLIVIAIMALLMAILIPGLDRVREMVRRTKCQAQLRGIGTALVAYGNDWKGRWPDAGRTNFTSPVNTTGSMWLLLEGGHVQAENLVCPTDEVLGLASPYIGVVDQATTPFPRTAAGRSTISYSYQIPHSYGDANNPTSGNPGRDHPNQTRMAVMADRSPFDHPQSPAPGKLLSAANAAKWGSADKSTGDKLQYFVSSILDDTERKAVNSNNHRGEGQNVLYRDGHTEWHSTPLAGINFDNIYTRSSATNLLGRAVGTAPTISQTPFDSSDSCLRTYPLP